MTESTSLYRRHRPGSFDEVVGQQHVVRTLRNAVERDKVHHAYLFVGSRGTGKTSMAKILARSLNCERGGPTLNPCGECESCLTIAAGTSVDVIEMDAASNRSVDDVRDLRERVAYAPAGGRWKVYILDEAHMLTKEAWNAFLKTLEEPPPRTVFVLATTESHKVMATIADRCQRFDFQRPSLEQISEVIGRVAAAESIEVEEGASAMIARAASGSFRDALGTLDQLVSFGGSKVGLDDVLELLGAADADLLFDAVDAVAAADPRAALLAVEQMARSGRDPAQFARDLLAHLRCLLITQTVGEVPASFVVTATDSGRLRAQADGLRPSALIATIDELAAALAAIREGDEARMAVEIALLKAARPDLDASPEGIVRRLERLEAALGGDGPEPPPPGRGSPAPAGQTEAGPPPAAAEPVDEGWPFDDGRGAARSDESSPSAEDAPGAGGSDESPASFDDGPEVGRSGGGTSPHDAENAEEADSDAGGKADSDADREAGGDADGKADSDAGGDPEGLHRLIGLWPAVLAQLSESGAPALAALFEGARPIAIDREASTLTVGFPASATFNKRKAEAAEKREQLAAALEAAAAERLAPVYVLLDGEREAAAAPASDGIDEDALLERMKSEFDAEEVS